jgi:putative aldouronate transport system permease protein
MSGKRRLQKLTMGDFMIPFVLILLALIIIIPVWYVFVVSLVPQHVFHQTRLLLWPREIVMDSYTTILNHSQIQSGFQNTIFVTLTSTAYVIFLNVTFAYAMLKPIPGRAFFWVFLMFTMFFSGGLVPYFLLVRNLGLVNNIMVMVLPHGVSIFTVILMQSYIRTLGPEYEESARLDGAGDITLLWHIILPLCKPMLATLSLIAAVGAWNRWFEGLMFMQRPEGWPLQLVLRNILANASVILEGVPTSARQSSFHAGLQMAAVMTTMLPIVCVYPFLQKYFVKGITLGGIKG